MMAMFVNFMFSNAVFMHVHKTADGTLVAHSHPYLPSGNHSHTSSSLDHIANFNAAASSFDAVAQIAPAAPQYHLTAIIGDYFGVYRYMAGRNTDSRGPPFA